MTTVCISCLLRLQSAVLYVAYFFMDFLLLSPVLHWLLPYKDICYIYAPSNIYHTHFVFLETVLVDNASWRCNMNERLLTILSFLRNTRTARRVKGFNNRHFLICLIWLNLITHFNTANDNKQTSHLCKMIPEGFIQLHSIIKKLSVQNTKFNLLTNGSCPLQSSPFHSQYTVTSVSANPGSSWWMTLLEWLWTPLSQPLE
jgi:hypothetical protein